MKSFQIHFLNYLLVIFITFSGTWYFISNDKNKLVSASEKSIPSVVTVISNQNKTFSNNRNGIGSGVIFSEDGYIVTNLHIISGDEIYIKLEDGNNFPASIIGVDQNTDIAVLKIISDEKLKPINFADSDELKIGDDVLAIGNPYGIGISVSNGIISATGRDYGNPYLQLIQTDAAVNPGNSGGALINTSGELVGMISKIYSVDGTFSGISFALPIDTITKISSQIIKFGSAKKAWIGNFKVIQRKVFINSEISPCLEIIDLASGPLKDNFGVKNSDCIFKINSKKATWDNLNQTLL